MTPAHQSVSFRERKGNVAGSCDGRIMSALATSDDPEFQALNVSAYVRRARRLADLSQRDLADVLGIDQAQVARLEAGQDPRLSLFERTLAMAGLKLMIVDQEGAEVAPMPDDVLRDRAGRRQPAHLDVYARPDLPTLKMLLHGADPRPRESWHHRRDERDRLRASSGSASSLDQTTAGVATHRRRNSAVERARARQAGD